MVPKDTLFKDRRERVEAFGFGRETAAVFDDMLERSVPFYAEIQRMTGELAADFAVPGSRLYDLGCSTGTTLAGLDRVLDREVAFIGVDASPAMLERARDKLGRVAPGRSCELLCRDLNEGVSVANASVVIMNLTLQFIRPANRDRVVAEVAAGLNQGGCLILVEKVLSPHSTLNRLFIEHYHQFKRRKGYSELEIAQKREALEHVLIPYPFEENLELLLGNGFRAAEAFFRWYNFCGLVALK